MIKCPYIYYICIHKPKKHTVHVLLITPIYIPRFRRRLICGIDCTPWLALERMGTMHAISYPRAQYPFLLASTAVTSVKNCHLPSSLSMKRVCVCVCVCDIVVVCRCLSVCN